MNKLFIFLFSFGFFLSIFSQESYYSNVNFSLNGIALKEELATKITTTHTNFLSYTPGVWNASKATDVNPKNTSEVILIYGYTSSGTTARTRNIDNNGGGQGQWNREHTYPRSLGNPNLGSSGPGADAHHLRPSDVQYNGQRGSLRFVNGSGNSGNVSGGWYPGDEWKGDIARMMMYMYLRYGNQCLPSVVGVGNNTSTPDDMIDLFLNWNAEDPVSDFERQRNTYHENTNNTYAQGNRNPFIDNAYLATKIWGGTPAEDSWGIFTSQDNEAPTTPTNVSTTNITARSFQISWSASTDNKAVSSYEIYLNDNLVGESTSIVYNANNLSPETNYTITIIAKDLTGNKSTASAPVNVTTLKSTTNSSNEIFFSEYVEGSGFNKALEITNNTNNTINLSSYTIKRQSKGIWEDPLQLIGSIGSNNVYVIINASATIAKLQTEKDLTTENTTPMTFNGDDRIGLFKNDVLIDIIGDLDGSSEFAKNITLRRKPIITGPTTNYSQEDWTVFNMDDVSGIGNHTITLRVKDVFLNNLKMYPNPNSGKNLFFTISKTTKITIFNVLGKQVKSFTLNPNNNNIDISDLSKGVYLVKISGDNTYTTKKLIKH